jgi:hypothetical protein
MTYAEIDWNSVRIHHSNLTVRLSGEWAHNASWVACFNNLIPPMFTMSWGQISGRSATFGAWDQISARDNGVITVHALAPGHAADLRDALEQYVAQANNQMASLTESRHRADQEDTAESDACDQAMMEEFKRLLAVSEGLQCIDFEWIDATPTQRAVKP